MTDIYFHGHGDWFFKTDNGIRPLTSKARLICNEHLKTLESDGIDISYTNIALRRCQPFSAVFKLTPSDEKSYSITKSKKILKKRLVKLLPSLHPGSSFLECVEKGLLSIDDIDNCYFIIQTLVKYSQEESAKDVKFKIKILNKDTYGIDNTKTSSETEKKSTKKALKHRYAEKDGLTDLIHHFLASISIYPDDPKPFGSGAAWKKLILDYKDENNLIKSIAKDKRSIFLNSIENEEINKSFFGKRYNAQFITKDWIYLKNHFTPLHTFLDRFTHFYIFPLLSLSWT